MTTFISNSCTGGYMCKKYGKMPYRNPFIWSLIPNDEDFLKLCT